MTGLLPSDLRPVALRGETGHRAMRRATARRTPAVNFGPVGKCPDKPTLLIITCDNSGSVAGSSGAADPIGARFEEARLAIEAVSKKCRCGDELVAVLNFDSPNSGDVPPTPLRTGMAEIEKGLQIPGDGGGCSLLGPSLYQAMQIAAAHPDHQAIFCALTDFALFDSDVSRVLADFAAFPGQPHALVLGGVVPPQLNGDDRVIVSQINRTDPPGTLAKAVFEALAGPRPGRGRNKT